MGSYIFIFLTLLICLLLNLLSTAKSQELETYIVHVETPSSTFVTSDLTENLQDWYRTFLTTTTPTSNTNTDESPRILYSYRNVFKGFAAKLTPEQVESMRKIPGFISARPQKTYSLHTTHSPNFLGLNQNTGFWQASNYGKGVIIGVLDTGINPDHPSFSDEGMPPPPTKWKGKCDFSDTTLCNNKLIGARKFTIGNGTPYDEDGHGSHTAGTAAGYFVDGANVFGVAKGTASGIAPLAHVASYKVCLRTCSESDIVAALDAAIDDGVDILSISLGGPLRDFYDDNVAAGAFSAIEKGIFVSVSGGNDGPFLGTVNNVAPWLLTVGASSIDRKLRATAMLGDNQEFNGESNYQPSSFDSSTFLPLIYPGMNSGNTSAQYCTPEALANVDVRGKIVLCDDGLIGRIAKGQAVKAAGGSAMILANLAQQGYTIFSDSNVLPATHINYADGLKIKTYLNSTSEPTATISFKGTVIGDDTAPMVASFSSRGPNGVSPGILKPDILGPGLNILAAWHVSVENNTNSKSNFNIIAGTSMSCPHLSGVAALLKSAHPDWSPAAIKSAIMTTANQVNLAGNAIMDQTLRSASHFATGSGHVNILKANDPGLVYDLEPQDYVPYLCGLNYTDQQIGIIVSSGPKCSDVTSIPEAGLNYPSFSVILGNGTETYNRTVTNVGEANTVYNVEYRPLPFVVMEVEPSRLEFTELNQKLTYQVSFRRLGNVGSGIVNEGFITWKSDKYSVRSPVVVVT